MIPVGINQWRNGGGGILGCLDGCQSAGLDAINLVFVLVEQPLHGGRDVVHVQFALLAVHQNLGCQVVAGNDNVGLVGVEDVVVNCRGFGDRSFGFDQFQVGCCRCFQASVSDLLSEE